MNAIDRPCRARVRRRPLCLVLALVALAGCAPRTPIPPLHDSMSQVVAPEAQTLWNISNKAMNDAGEPDASKLSTADWNALLDASRTLKDRAGGLATARTVTVVKPGDRIQDEGAVGGSSAAQVQQFINADVADFNGYAKTLEAAADEFAAASSAKDVKRLAAVSDHLEEVCEACHVKFWYPQQNKAR